MSDTIDLQPLQKYLDEVAPRGRTMLLPALHYAQSLFGWLPRQVQEAISRGLRVPAAEVHGVVEFYTMFTNQPPPTQLVHVCDDLVCQLYGVEEVIAALEQQSDLAIERVPCLGMCEHAPAALDRTHPIGGLTPATLPTPSQNPPPPPEARIYGSPRWLTRRLNRIQPSSLEDYLQHGGYRALRKAVRLPPEEIITQIEHSGILGRGGAMFPLGRKWRFTRAAPGSPAEKHIVVNADESEPGTFKDRYLLEGDPLAVIEAATLAAYAVGAENGWIFVRGEYPRSFQILQEAVRQAREAGYLGKDILGKKGFHFDIELRLGAGAYICGEETALFEAIEGRRGFPRIKPPFPTTQGLFQQPTAINNVETLVAALVAFEMGNERWRSVGSAESPGTKLFCLSGQVAHPGVYEVPFGVSVGELIDLGGGIADGGAVQAVLIGGAAGVFIPPEKLDFPLTYEASRAQNIPLGSAAVVVFDDTVDLRQPLYHLSRFFAHESCGKCFPCQLGTQRQMEILARIALNGGPRPGDRQSLLDVGFTMTKTSLCGLGQTAASAILSAVETWPQLLTPPDLSTS